LGATAKHGKDFVQVLVIEPVARFIIWVPLLLGIAWLLL
jgi:hypothetical protein